MAWRQGHGQGQREGGRGVVELGFLEVPENGYVLRSRYLPSKAGGRPAWLELRDLPAPASLQCGYCQGPMTFLLQVYTTNHADLEAYHRSVFLFVCSHAPCHAQGPDCIRAFRSQLGRQNDFYGVVPPRRASAVDAQTGDELGEAGRYGPLCWVCGCRGDSKCSQCQLARYCSRDHQLLHWKHMGHKDTCSKPPDTQPPPPTEEDIREISRALLPEYEVVSDTEDDEEDDDNNEDEDMPALSGDPLLDNFRQRLMRNPEQVARFLRGNDAGAVWEGGLGAPLPGDIPPCEQCGSPRQLDFQVLPQVLYLLRLTAWGLDWGVLGVYVCSNSCRPRPNLGAGLGGYSKYVQEFVWRQRHAR